MIETQTLYNVIAILVKRLGGEVIIEDKELGNPPIASVTNNYGTGKIIIKID